MKDFSIIRMRDAAFFSFGTTGILLLLTLYQFLSPALHLAPGNIESQNRLNFFASVYFFVIHFILYLTWYKFYPQPDLYHSPKQLALYFLATYFTAVITLIVPLFLSGISIIMFVGYLLVPLCAILCGFNFIVFLIILALLRKIRHSDQA